MTLRQMARLELSEAKLWYDSQLPGLGEIFLKEADKVLKKLEDSPEIFPLYYRGFRRLMMHRFPYKIFFRVNKNRVIIFRVLHTKRDHYNINI
ncbi:MAG: type II toxin-antitoxin system RelE/ParE family toxin [Verrucomicrobiae bacterium]|nr:type II toxin-antitoxin system RelE/ParE family toxin [Verrucomicrobiae bacterium]